MIPKGNQRGGGRQLATHLLNQFDNENVEVAEVRGAIAQDLHGAFAEWRAQADQTQCSKYLYSLSVNPDNAKYDLTREQYLDFITRAEKKMGLTDQPRAVVFHTKSGRQHCHVVWSRIDTESMKAVQISHDRQKLRTVAQDFARDHGLELPDRMKRDRGKDRYKDRQKNSDLTEKQQQERTGETKEQRQQAVTSAWTHSDNAQAFIHALQSKGYHIARGDKRSFVIVDRYGEVHSLSRQIDGVKAKDLNGRLASVELPSLDAAKETVRLKQESRLEQQKEQEKNQRQELEFEERRKAYEGKRDERRGALDRQKTDQDSRHVGEHLALRELHSAQDEQIRQQRAARQPRGMAAFLTRITGIQTLIARRHEKQDLNRTGTRKIEAEALQRRHDRERQEMDRRFSALAMVEQRERQSLETRIERDHMREALQDRHIDLTADFERVARQEEERRETQDQKQFKPEFTRVAAPEKEQAETGGRFSGLFNRVSSFFSRHHDIPAQNQQPTPPPPEHQPEPQQPQPEFQLEPPPPADLHLAPGDLTQAFQDRAEQKERQAEDRGPERSIEPPGPGRRD